MNDTVIKDEALSPAPDVKKGVTSPETDNSKTRGKSPQEKAEEQMNHQRRFGTNTQIYFPG